MKRRTYSRLAWVSQLAVLAVACSPASPPPPNLGVHPLPTVDAALDGPTFLSPSHWYLSGTPRWQASGSLPLDAGETLWFGEGGERWLEGVKGLVGSDSLIPEKIVGAQRVDGSFRFVGESGAVYLSKDALGAATKAGKGVDKPRTVTVAKSSIFVVDHAGELLRSADGKVYSKVDVTGRDGPVVDVAMSGQNGLLVVAPQRLFATKDEGVTWTPVKSPGDGVRGIRSELGTIVLEGIDKNYQLDTAYGTFSEYTGSSARRASGPKWATADASAFRERHMDGKHVVEVVSEGKQTTRSWSFAAYDLGQSATPRHLEELDGCDAVHSAVRGETVVLTCDARGSVAGGVDKDASGPIRQGYGRNGGLPDGGTLGFVTKILRSDDFGRTFREDGTVEGGIPTRGDEALAIGESGWLYLSARCGQGYQAACLPARIRPTTGGNFSELGADDDQKIVSFASNALQTTVYAIQADGDDARLLRFRAGSAAAEDLGTVGSHVDTGSVSLSLDDDGTVHGFTRSGATAKAFTYKDGAGMAAVNLPPEVTRAAFGGIHGLAQSQKNTTTGYETNDGGKTWGKVALPEFVNDIDACNALGCIVDRGVRVGWDAPMPMDTTDAAAAKDGKPVYSKPLRCSAKDKWIALGGGWLPTIENVDHASNRWVMPARSKDGTISLVANKRGDAVTKTTSTALLGAAPQPPKFGAGTTMHVQPDGVVVLRYSYARERKGPGRFNPVDASIVWYRDATGKVSRASVPKMPPFRVEKDPRGEFGPTDPYRTLPEVLTLGPKGVYFRSPAVDQETDDDGNPKATKTALVLLRDDGKIDRLKFPAEVDGDHAAAWSIDGTLAITGASSEQWRMFLPNDGRVVSWAVMGGLDDAEAPVSYFTMGGKPLFVATLRSPARAWGIPMRTDVDLGPSFVMPTQKSLGDMPKACDGVPTGDPGSYAFDAPWVNGSRHPVIVDIDGVAQILATDRARVRGTQAGAGKDACVAAMEALPGDSGSGDDVQYGALIFPDDLTHSILFQAKTGDWPATIAARTLECAYTTGPLPDDLKGIDGFTE